MLVRLRDLRPGEQEPVRAVFDGLSARSRIRRFHGPGETAAPRDARRHVGRRLVTAVKARAAVPGLQWIEADVLDANAPMLHLLRDVFSGIEASRIGDVWELRCPVPSSGLQFADVLPALQGVA